MFGFVKRWLIKKVLPDIKDSIKFEIQTVNDNSQRYLQINIGLVDIIKKVDLTILKRKIKVGSNFPNLNVNIFGDPEKETLKQELKK